MMEELDAFHRCILGFPIKAFCTRISSILIDFGLHKFSNILVLYNELNLTIFEKIVTNLFAKFFNEVAMF
jgi:hypothetical protein